MSSNTNLHRDHVTRPSDLVSAPQKKILFVTRPLSPPWDEASKNFAYDLACNTTNQDITILVDKYIDNIPSHITQQKIYTDNHFSLLQKIYSFIFQIISRKKFDIIHYMFTPARLNSLAINLCIKNSNTKSIQTVATLRKDIYSDTEIKKFMFGDTIVTYSKWAKTKLENLGFNNVAQIYPGFNFRKFVPASKDAKLMKKWNITDKNFVVTYPGEFVRLGATDLIVDTFIQLWQNPDNSHIKYLCACRIKNKADAKKKQEVIKKITDAGHIDKVAFTDTFPDVNAVYNMSDTVIFPVTNMAGKFDVPLAMIEPYACKKPVIASDLELFKEFSNEKINVIVKQNNSEELASAILDLAKNEQKRKALGENAYDFAHQTFNIKNTASQYQNIYN